MSENSTSRSRKPVLALLAANTISQIGNVVALVAIPWFVFQTTESAAKTGLTGFFSVLPVVLAGFFGGALVDRVGHRRSSIISDLLSGLSVVLIPLLYLTVGLSFWQLVILVFLGALLDMPGGTARQALVPDLADLAGMSRDRINAAYQTIQQASFLFGPPIAGLLIAVVGATNVLWLNAASFAISAVLFAVAVPQIRQANDDRPESSGDYLKEVLEGWRFVARERVIFALTIANAASNFLGAPLFAVILPIYASQVFGNSVDLGLMLGGAAAGSLFGAVLYGMVGHHLPRRWLYAGGWVVGTFPLWALAGTPPLLIAVSALVILGLSDGPINPLMQTLSQERTPHQLRGRVFGARIALANVAAPLGMLTVGFLVEFAGLRPTIILMAVLHSLAALGVVFCRVFYELDVSEGSNVKLCGSRSGGHRKFQPHPGILTLGSLLLVIGLMFASFFSTVGTMATAGIVTFAVGWILIGSGMKPIGSMRVGAAIATGVYALIGLAVTIVTVLPQPDTPITGIAPGTESFSTLIVIALLWPLILIRPWDRSSKGR